ncbi:hypothetical protein JNM05_14475 [bacterium]|nr:hypothetical protein [bacterium]
MNKNRCLFLDTTVIVDYALKAQRRKAISAEKEKYDNIETSQYIKMEIRRGVLTYLVYLYNMIVDENSWDGVLQRVSKLSGTPQRHRLGLILESMKPIWKGIKDDTPASLNEKYPEIPLDRILVLESLKYLKYQIRNVWRMADKLAVVTNKMKCFVDIHAPVETHNLFDNTASKCTESKYECKIKDFFDSKRSDFVEIQDALNRLPESEQDDETKKRRGSLREINRLLYQKNRQFSNIEPNVKHCWRCGDAIIAVSAQDTNSDLLSSNKKHFVPICYALNNKLVTY